MSKKSNKLKTYRQVIEYLDDVSEKKFMKFINKDDNKDLGEKGWRQEGVCLVLMLSGIFESLKGFVPLDSDHYNKGKVIKIKSIDEYFDKKIRKGGSAADAFFINENSKEILVFTFKNRNNLGITKYDLPKISSGMLSLKEKEEYKDYKFFTGVVCKDKEEFESKLKNINESSGLYLKNIVFKEGCIIDNKELYRKWKVFNNKYNNFTKFDLKVLGNDSLFKLRFGQVLVTNKTRVIMEKEMKNKGVVKPILNNSECRFGKVHCSLKDILNFTSIKKSNKLSLGSNILVLTSQPSTLPTYERTIKKYGEFKDYVIINLNKVKEFKLEKDKICVFFVSVQKLRNYIGKDKKSKKGKAKKEVLGIKNVGLICIDEFHESGMTETVEEMFKSYKLENTLKIFYTATPSKVRKYYEIPKENCVGWTLEDNSSASKLEEEDITMLSYKFENVKEILKNYDIEEVRREYGKQPTFTFWTTMPTEECVKDFRKNINIQEGCEDEGYSNESLFMLNEEGKINIVEEENDDYILKRLYEFFGNAEFRIVCGQKRYKPSDKSYQLKKIREYCQKIGQRTHYGKGVGKRPLILPWYFGNILRKGGKGDNESNINLFCLQLREIMYKYSENFREKIWKEGEDMKEKIVVKIYNSENKKELVGETIEDCFENLVDEYREAKLVVLLLGSSLHTGVTNKYCDWIKFSCNIRSFQRLWQTMSRARNEVSNSNTEGVKKKAIILMDDFQGLSLSDVINKFKRVGEKQHDTYKRIIQQDLIDIYDYENTLIELRYDSKEYYESIYRAFKKNTNISKEITDSIAEMKFYMNLKYDAKLVLGLCKTDKQRKRLKKYIDSLSNGEKLKKGIISIKEFFNKDKKKEVKEIDDKEKEKMIIDYERLCKEIMQDVIKLLHMFTCNWDGFDVSMIFEGMKKVNTHIIENKNDITYYEILKNQVSISFPKLCEDAGDGVDRVDVLLGILGRMIVENTYLKEEISGILEDCRETNDYKKEMTMIDRYEAIIKFITTTTEEKKKNAEVLTPLKLVIEMIEKVPLEFWKRKDIKIFDPCVGKGAFVVVLYTLLLKKGFTRKKILEDVLYFGDKNKSNVFIVKMLLDPDNEFKLNYYIGDTLNMDIEEVFGLKCFDLVLGNPPYQMKVGKRKTETLWNKFFIKALNILREGGFVCYVHPSGWRNIDGKFKSIKKSILDKDLIYLEINGEKQGLKTFGCETRYDWYVLRNSHTPDFVSTVKFQDEKVLSLCLRNLEFIPNANYEKIRSLIAKPNEKKVSILHNYSAYETRKKWMSKTKTAEHIYPCVYTVNSKSELSYFYSSQKKEFFGVSKLIWSNGRISSIGSYVDADGEYGITQFAYALVDDVSNLASVKKAFDSKEFRLLMENCAVGQLSVNYKVIRLFRYDFWKEFI